MMCNRKKHVYLLQGGQTSQHEQLRKIMIKKEALNNPFWQFSTEIYRSPVVEKNLLSLQNERALNVNVILYCCWYALDNRGCLTKHTLQELLVTIQAWHEHLVLPLRRIAKILKPHRGGDWPKIRKAVLQQALFSEQVEQQLMMEKTAYSPQMIRTDKQKMNDVCKNILTYCRLVQAHLDIEDCQRLASILHVIFPQIDQDTILGYCIRQAEKGLQSVTLTAQLPLDL